MGPVLLFSRIVNWTITRSSLPSHVLHSLWGSYKVSLLSVFVCLLFLWALLIHSLYVKSYAPYDIPFLTHPYRLRKSICFPCRPVSRGGGILLILEPSCLTRWYWNLEIDHKVSWLSTLLCSGSLTKWGKGWWMSKGMTHMQINGHSVLHSYHRLSLFFLPSLCCSAL